ncbi:DUF805 domain-containing protein [Bradyrhizobium sp. CCBAU 51745]|uniref:DUF805 domain-containing protein n=1 Tax=Bradyrhizobium sp. CCBAU 51745 TaxID=1325099 RepID=UPI003FA46CB0
MQGAWYYAENGEAKGPLPFELLGQHLLSVRDADRLLVWRHGLDAWTVARELPELAVFVSRPPPVPAAPKQETSALQQDRPVDSATSLRTAFFSFKGRMGRTEYVGVLVASIVAFAVVVAAVKGIPDAKDNLLVDAGLIGAAALFIWVRLASSSKRLHDYSRSAWGCLWLIVPIVNVLLFLELIFRRGDSDKNQYGPPQTHF